MRSERTKGTSRADRGLLATLRELGLRHGEPPTSATVATAVGLPNEYAAFIERRLQENQERGFVQRDTEGRWLLTASGTAAAGIRWTVSSAAEQA